METMECYIQHRALSIAPSLKRFKSLDHMRLMAEVCRSFHLVEANTLLTVRVSTRVRLWGPMARPFNGKTYLYHETHDIHCISYR